MAGGTMISNGDTFKSNGVSASNIGGGGAVYLNATFLISGATFAGNHASGAEGVGGALAISPMGVLTSSTLTGNSATSTSQDSARAVRFTMENIYSRLRTIRSRKIPQAPKAAASSRPAPKRSPIRPLPQTR